MHDEFNKFDFAPVMLSNAAAETISEKHRDWACRRRAWGVDHSRTAAYIGINVCDREQEYLDGSGKPRLQINSSK